MASARTLGNASPEEESTFMSSAFIPLAMTSLGLPSKHTLYLSCIHQSEQEAFQHRTRKGETVFKRSISCNTLIVHAFPQSDLYVPKKVMSKMVGFN